MGVHSVSQLEVGSEVGEEQLLLRALSNDLKQLLVHRLLVGLALVIGLVGLLLLSEDVSVGGLLRLALLLHLEVLVVHVSRHLDLADVQLGAGHNDELLVHTAQRAFVHGEGAVDEEQTRGELLQKDDSLSTVATSEDDEDPAWLKTWWWMKRKENTC